MINIAQLGYEIDSSQARTAARDLDRMAASADKVERGYKSLKAASTNLLRDDRGRFISAADSAAKYGAEIDALRTKYNPLYAASKQLEQSQNEIRRALELGAISAMQADAAMERLAQQYTATGTAAGGYAKASNAASMQSANVFAQLNDIGVMMASGQNPLILAIQQGAQLNQTWDQMGGKIGSVKTALASAFTSMISPINLVTIGVIALGTAAVQWLMSSENSAKTFGEALDDIQFATSNINAAYKMLSSEGMTDVFNAYGALNEKVRENVLLMAEAAIYKEFDRIKEAATALRDEMTGGWLTTDIDDVRNAFGTTNDEARRYLRLIEDIGRASTFEDQAAAAKVLRDELLSGGRTLNDFDGSARDIVIKVIEMADGAERLSVQVNKSKNLGEAFSKLDLAGGVSAAGDAALVLANRLGISLETAKKLAALGPQGLGETGQVGAGGGRGGDPRKMGGSALDYQVYQADLWLAEWEKKQKEAKKGGGGGGGGGGGSDQYQSNLQQLIESLQTEQETVDAWYQSSLQILNDRRAEEILGQQAHNEAKIALETEYQSRLAELQSQEMSRTLGHYNTLFGNMANIAKAGGDKATGVVKAFSVAQGLINSYLAYTQVLADPSLVGRPFLRTALAASTLAAGLAQVANMKSGGSGGASASTSSATSAAASAPTRTTLIELTGGDEFINGYIRDKLGPALYEFTKDGGVIQFA